MELETAQARGETPKGKQWNGKQLGSCHVREADLTTCGAGRPMNTPETTWKSQDPEKHPPWRANTCSSHIASNNWEKHPTGASFLRGKGESGTYTWRGVEETCV